MPKPKKNDRKNVTYRGRCTTCGLVYIRETSQWLRDRKGQHQQCCRRQDVTNSFYCHLLENPDHQINWDDFDVLDSEMRWKNRKVKESIYINAESDGGNFEKIMNLEKGEYLDPCWNEALSIIQKGLHKTSST